MLNYELAKQLKEAGFPQYGSNRDGDGNRMEITETDCLTEEEIDKLRLPGPTYMGNVKVSDKGIVPVHPCYLPTLSELIEACGEEFDSLSKDPSGWCAEAWAIINGKRIPDEFVGGCSTPEEAVAKLFIALNKK